MLLVLSTIPAAAAAAAERAPLPRKGGAGHSDRKEEITESGSLLRITIGRVNSGDVIIDLESHCCYCSLSAPLE